MRLFFGAGAETDAGDAVAAHDGDAVRGECPFVDDGFGIEEMLGIVGGTEALVGFDE